MERHRSSRFDFRDRGRDYTFVALRHRAGYLLKPIVSDRGLDIATRAIWRPPKLLVDCHRYRPDATDPPSQCAPHRTSPLDPLQLEEMRRARDARAAIGPSAQSGGGMPSPHRL